MYESGVITIQNKKDRRCLMVMFVAHEYEWKYLGLQIYIQVDSNSQMKRIFIIILQQK